MEQKMAQLRIRPRAIIAEGCGGTIFWATPSRARLLIDAGAVELVNAPTGPANQPAVGPSETNPAGPLEKKSFAAGPDGPSTDSQSSSEPGKAALLSVSEADRPSLLTNAEPLARRGRVRPRRG